jgi:hypothetical protein
MTIQALLPVRHWTHARKAEVVWALSHRLITIEQACVAHGLTREELETWTRRHCRFGADGLKVARVRQLRMAEGRAA